MSFNFGDYIKLKVFGKHGKRALDLIDELEDNEKKEPKDITDSILEELL
ncbi:hypothetical protein [Mycoplasma leachii]